MVHGAKLCNKVKELTNLLRRAVDLDFWDFDELEDYADVSVVVLLLDCDIRLFEEGRKSEAGHPGNPEPRLAVAANVPRINSENRVADMTSMSRLRDSSIDGLDGSADQSADSRTEPSRKRRKVTDDRHEGAMEIPEKKPALNTTALHRTSDDASPAVEVTEEEGASDESSDVSSSSGSSDSDSESMDDEDDDDLNGDEDEGGSEAEDDGDKEGKDDYEDLTSLGRKPKPVFDMPIDKLRAYSEHFKGFLEQMEESNKELQRALEAGELEGNRIEDVDEGDDGYIEMDLGLGVLEDKNGEDDALGDEEDDASGDEEDSDEEEQGSPADGEIEEGVVTRPKEKNVLRRLMGQKRGQKVGIEEVEGDSET